MARPDNLEPLLSSRRAFYSRGGPWSFFCFAWWSCPFASLDNCSFGHDDVRMQRLSSWSGASLFVPGCVMNHDGAKMGTPTAIIPLPRRCMTPQLTSAPSYTRNNTKNHNRPLFNNVGGKTASDSKTRVLRLLSRHNKSQKCQLEVHRQTFGKRNTSS